MVPTPGEALVEGAALLPAPMSDCRKVVLTAGTEERLLLRVGSKISSTM